MTNSLRECFAITDDAVRVACYDALAQQQGAVKPVPALPAAAAAAEATQDAGAAGDTTAVTDARGAGFDRQATVTTEADATDVFRDTVARVDQVEPTKLQITLASGQVWRQAIGKTFRVRAGERVSIRGTGWGKAFRLSVEGRPGYIQVSRTR